ncbi:hypothetical protein [Methylobacterium gossipiicola]|nr:hypothetical protein [Methylobacterium gossipiicola]
MIAGGADRNAGIFDRIRALLDERLSGAPAATLRAPFPRVLASLRDGVAFCFIGGVKTPEREAFAVFSLPVALFYPVRIIVPASERARFAALAPLSLATLLADRTLRTSVLRSRSLGSRVDSLLAQAASPHLHAEFDEALRMLFAKRLDYLVEYPTIASYGARSLGQADAFAALPFIEEPEPVFARVMCPKTPWGRRLVERIDAILRVERTTPAYRQIVEAWADPDDLPTIRNVYDNAFLKSE